MPEIPPEAVQAAAEAVSLHYAFCDAPRWQDCAKCVCVVGWVERALKAAAPIIAEHGLTVAPAIPADLRDRMTAAALDDELTQLRKHVEYLNDLIRQERAIHEETIRRAEQAEAAIARVRALHHIHRCEVDGHMFDHTPTPCLNDNVCMGCGRTPCETLAALSEEADR